MNAAIAPLLIALFSFYLRIKDLARPKGFVFDEVYYVDGARDLIKYGVEVTGSRPEFVVHPPLGKWLIAVGIKLFGDNEFGWRFSVAVVGALLILLIALIAHRLFASRILTAAASLLMALDGLALVHSRTALLDLFLTFFILIATYFWLQERFVLVGIALGCALAIKWSAAYFLLFFVLISLYRIFTHLELIEMPRAIVKKFGSLTLVPLGLYLMSWWGWFASARGWDRNWSKNPFASLWHYHAEMLHFHTTLTQRHSYQANPWSWSLMLRPTSFFYATPKGCGAPSCSQEVLALGTPLLWWSGTIALAVAFGLWVSSIYRRKSDRALNVIMIGIGAGYLPWFFFQKRTVFSFYAIIFEPFLILALIYCAHRLLMIPGRRRDVTIGLGIFLLVLALNFFYFLPLFNATPLTYDSWLARMWLPSWI